MFPTVAGIIVGRSAQLLKGSTSEVTSVSKLYIYRYTRNKIIPGTSEPHLVRAYEL